MRSSYFFVSVPRYEEYATYSYKNYYDQYSKQNQLVDCRSPEPGVAHHYFADNFIPKEKHFSAEKLEITKQPLKLSYPSNKREEL